MSFGPFHGLAIWKEYKNDEIDGNWDIPDLNHFPVLCKAALSKKGESVFKQIKDTRNKQTKLLEFGLPVGGGEGELCNWIRE